MYPKNSALRRPHRDVQPCGGVLADASPVAGRHTTRAVTVSFFLATRDPSPMSSPGMASTHPFPPLVHDRALWATAQQLIVQHLAAPSGDRCANSACVAVYPCTPSRVGAMLAAASLAPFHQKMTALLDAQSCAVSPPSTYGLAAPTRRLGAELAKFSRPAAVGA
jgi:hypothetical protein